MASVSSSTLIIFIASILVAASVAGTMTNGVQRLSDALGDRSIDVANEIQTDVEIISDPAMASSIYNNSTNTLTVLVKNTGSETLAASANSVDVIVDGQFQTNVSVSVVNGPDWGPGNVARVEVSNVDLGTGDHRVLIVVNGDREMLRFRL
ncbi:MAG: CARDB domain-containing protein [Halobacterium sp.]